MFESLKIIWKLQLDNLIYFIIVQTSPRLLVKSMLSRTQTPSRTQSRHFVSRNPQTSSARSSRLSTLCVYPQRPDTSYYKTSKFTFDKFPVVVDWDYSDTKLWQCYTKNGETSIEDVLHPSQWHTKVLDSATSIPYNTLNSPQKKRRLLDLMTSPPCEPNHGSSSTLFGTPDKLQPQSLKLEGVRGLFTITWQCDNLILF